MEQSKAPDPYETSLIQDGLQQGYNTQAAQEQQRMNMTNQSTPYGSLTYTSDPNSPSGYTANQSYTPGVQAAFDANLSNSTNAANQAGTILNSGALTKPLDLSWGATESAVDAINKNTLDPQWADRQNQFDQSMAQRGVVPGSAAYDSAYRDFTTSRDNAYQQSYLQGHQTAVNDITSQWQSPFNAFNAVRSGAQIQSGPGMGFTTTPQESISAPQVNYSGLAEQNYQNQVQQNNASMGGMFGLGGTIGSGLMQGIGKAGGMAAFFSDVRLKTDIHLVGQLHNGLPVYVYRYKSGGPMQIGLMAQDVEKVRPDAVEEVDGFKAVHYGKAVA